MGDLSFSAAAPGHLAHKDFASLHKSLGLGWTL